MTLCWIIRKVRMISGVIVVGCLLFCTPISSAKSRGDSSSRPLVISLPMRVGVEGGRSSFYEDSTEVEPRGEQRLVQRVFDPYSDNDYAQDDNGDQENNENFQAPNFLQWNPNNRFMVLQISDFIGSRPVDNDDPPNDSQEDDEDEHEEADDTRVKKKRRRPSQQGTFDFEDFRRMPEPRRNRPKTKKKKSKDFSSERRNRKREDEEQQEDEEDGDERDVYGTDPVVHYLKERRGKDRKRDFGFGGMGDDDGDEFTMKEWWNY